MMHLIGAITISKIYGGIDSVVDTKCMKIIIKILYMDVYIGCGRGKLRLQNI